tara:strand:- start:182 stop:1234 length:1053 start_codon:yes stop_codon:yes gene_type:complete
MCGDESVNFKQAIQCYATLALQGVEKPFPYHFSSVFRGAQSLSMPSEIHPVFYGCFDWHSAVHGHWLLALASEICSDSEFSNRCVEALNRTMTPAALATEAVCLESNPSFERPYGLAWILMLGVEIDRSSDPRITGLASSLNPVVAAAFENLQAWLPKLTHPVRTGTHNQSAFSMKLSLDWARHTTDERAIEMLESNARRFFVDDHSLALHLEPSGEDFLSPALSEAWLMASVMDDDEFPEWFDGAFVVSSMFSELRPLVPVDRTDGRLVHLDGLNLSRSWMLGALAMKLKTEHQLFDVLREASIIHGRAGLRAALSDEYMASHWLGTFAAYQLRELDGFLAWDDFFLEQ